MKDIKTLYEAGKESGFKEGYKQALEEAIKIVNFHGIGKKEILVRLKELKQEVSE